MFFEHFFCFSRSKNRLTKILDYLCWTTRSLAIVVPGLFSKPDEVSKWCLQNNLNVFWIKKGRGRQGQISLDQMIPFIVISELFSEEFSLFVWYFLFLQLLWLWEKLCSFFPVQAQQSSARDSKISIITEGCSNFYVWKTLGSSHYPLGKTSPPKMQRAEYQPSQRINWVSKDFFAKKVQLIDSNYKKKFAF